MFRGRENVHLLRIVDDSFVFHISEISRHFQISAIVYQLGSLHHDIVELDTRD